MIAYQDIKISSLVSLGLEGISIFFIMILAFIVLGKTQFAPDPAQFSFKTVTLSTLGLGVVVAVFSGVGFESSTAFGEESKDPLKSIPRSVNWSLIATGVFFVFITYVEVLGTHGYSKTLDQLDAPLNTLAVRYGVSAFAPIISAGAMCSFFALALTCLNAGSRVIFAMGRHDFFPRGTSAVHKVHETPHVALGFMAVLMFAIASICKMKTFGMEVLDIFNDAGTMGAFGFLGAYFLVTIAAPVFLKKRGELKAKDVFFCAAGVLLMCIPAVGSVYPVPAPPQNTTRMSSWATSHWGASGCCSCTSRLRRGTRRSAPTPPGALPTPTCPKPRPPAPSIEAPAPAGGLTGSISLDRLPARPDSRPYGPLLKRFKAGFVKRGRQGLPVERLGEAIHLALTAARPKARYVVLRNRFVNWTVPLLLPKMRPRPRDRAGGRVDAAGVSPRSPRRGRLII